jgi:hypothetical protein
MKKKNMWVLPPSGQDEYLVVRIPKKTLKEGDEIGKINVSLSPAVGKTFTLGEIQPFSVCCDGLCYSK